MAELGSLLGDAPAETCSFACFIFCRRYFPDQAVLGLAGTFLIPGLEAGTGAGEGKQEVPTGTFSVGLGRRFFILLFLASQTPASPWNLMLVTLPLVLE